MNKSDMEKWEEVKKDLDEKRAIKFAKELEELRKKEKNLKVIEDDHLREEEVKEYKKIQKNNRVNMKVIYIERDTAEQIADKIDFYQRATEINEKQGLVWYEDEEMSEVERIIIYLSNYNGKRLYPSLLKNKHKAIETETKAYIYVNDALLIHIKDGNYNVIKEIEYLDPTDMKKALSEYDKHLNISNKVERRQLIDKIITDDKEIKKQINKYRVIKEIDKPINAVIYVDSKMKDKLVKRVDVLNGLNSNSSVPSVMEELLKIIRNTMVKNPLKTIENMKVIKNTGKTFIYLETVLFISFDK